MNQTTKTVFITGASRGIGRAIAIRFAAAGYRLALCCRHNSDMRSEERRVGKEGAADFDNRTIPY